MKAKKVTAAVIAVTMTGVLAGCSSAAQTQQTVDNAQQADAASTEE